jgi:hypothetical protein
VIAAGATALPALADAATAGPLGLLVIALLGIATYFLGRSMAKHLRRVPQSFDQPGPPAAADEPEQPRD